jgi:UDP-4-amino-4-deoxy-L-arabinose-oxoglutarate aminotransferase
MDESFLPFSRPSISDDDVAAVTDVLRSGWITSGSRTSEFEARFRDRLGCTGAVALSSATAGMHLLLRALDIGPGDEVVTPSMTWVSTVNLIVLCGARPVFVDVDRDTMMTTAAHVEGVIGERTRLIVPVHFAGASVDLDPLRALARQWNVPMVEDAAHALGTTYRGDPIGRQGTAIFSFHPIKNITTGEGGMLCSEDAALIDRVRRLRFHGLDVDAYDRETRGRVPQAEVQEPGYKYNMTDIAAALGLGQLARLDEFNRKRATLSARYRARLAELPEVRPLELPGYPMGHAWNLFVVRIADEARVSRDGLTAGLKERGIGTGRHFRAVHLQRYYRNAFPVRPGDLPNTEWNSARLCSLPLFPDMSTTEVDRVVDAIRVILRG